MPLREIFFAPTSQLRGPVELVATAQKQNAIAAPTVRTSPVVMMPAAGTAMTPQVRVSYTETFNQYVKHLALHHFGADQVKCFRNVTHACLPSDCLLRSSLEATSRQANGIGGA